MKPTKHNKLMRKIGLTTATIAATTIGAIGLTSTQASAKQDESWITYYSELADGGYADAKNPNIDFNKSVDPTFVPQFTSKTKFSIKNGHSVKASDKRPAAVYKNFGGNKFKYYYVKYNPIAKYTNVGKVRGKEVDMTIKVGKPGAKPTSSDMKYSYDSVTNRKIAFPTNMLGVMPMKGYNTPQGSKARFNNKTYSVPYLARTAAMTNLTISFYYHGTKTKVKFDTDHTVGLGYMEMEPAWYYKSSKTWNNHAFSYAQRVLTYTNPIAVGNYNGKSGKSSTLAINDAKQGVLRVRQGTVFPKSVVDPSYIYELSKAVPESSALAEYKKNDIQISWRGHGPYDDLLDLNSQPYIPPKSKPQPSPKKYVGPQSAKPSSYSATKSALTDYTKTFSWKIQQKTKKASYSGKGYTVTDKLPAGTTISSVTVPTTSELSFFVPRC